MGSSPSPGDKAVPHFPGILLISKELRLQRAVFQSGPDDHESRCHDTRDQRPQLAEKYRNCNRLENKPQIPGMAHIPIRAGATHGVAAIRLDAYRR